MSRVWLLVILTSCLFLLSTLATAEQTVGSGYVPIDRVTKTSDRSVVVESGDHLWAISARGLANDLNREVTTREIAPYWRETIDLNVAGLRSGNPDLIYPGEVVTLPEPSND